MEVLDEVYQNLKILHSTSIDGSVICDVNLNVNKIAIIIGTQKSQNSRSQNPVLHLYSASTAEKERELVLPVDYLKSLKFSQTGQFLIAYGLASDIIVISINDRDQKLQILKGHSYFVDSIHIQKQEKLFVSAASFDYLCLWSLEEFKLLKRFPLKNNKQVKFTLQLCHNLIISWLQPLQMNDQSYGIIKEAQSQKSYNLKTVSIIQNIPTKKSFKLLNLIESQSGNHYKIIGTLFSQISQYRFYIRFKSNYNSLKQSILKIRMCVFMGLAKGNLLIKQNLDDSVIILKALEKKKSQQLKIIILLNFG